MVARMEQDVPTNTVLFEYWLAHVRRTVRNAREASGLTQDEIAARNKKPTIWAKRVEDADCTLGDLVDYLMTCGVVPFNVELMHWQGGRFVEAESA